MQRMKRHRRLVRGAMFRMQHRALSKAFESWQLFYVAMCEALSARRRVAMETAIQRWLRRHMCMAWNTWHLWASNMRCCQNTMRSTIRRMLFDMIEYDTV